MAKVYEVILEYFEGNKVIRRSQCVEAKNVKDIALSMYRECEETESELISISFICDVVQVIKSEGI